LAWTVPRTWVTGELVTGSLMNTHLRDNLNAVLPVGALMLRAAPYATAETVVESRWLQCNGVAVSRTTYSVLFNHLNAQSPALPFGVGNGTTTFTLPDLRGRAAWAEGEHGDADSMGDSEGQAIAGRTPKHYHRANFGSNSLGGQVPAIGVFDTAVTFSTITTAGTAPATTYGAQDTPAYLVVGSWFIKYTS
jgi:microcystin-dependent protein